MSLVTVKAVCKSFGAHDVLQAVSLTVSPGERVALLGRNGCGKSTLLRIIAGRDQPDSGVVMLAKKARLGYLTQQLDEIGEGDAITETAQGLADLLALEQELSELATSLAERGTDPDLLRRYERTACAFEARDGYTWQQRVRTILLGLGLHPDALHRSASLLSGGERMRIALARLLLQSPDILLLDEPTNHLDLTATQWLEGFLRTFPGACLLVSHDRYFLDAVTQRVIEIEDSRATTYAGNFTAYSLDKQQRQADMARRAQKMQWQMQREKQLVSQYKSMRNFHAAASREKSLQRLKKAYQPPARAEKQPTIAITQPQWVSNLIAEGNDVVMNYGKQQVLDHISFEIKGGERVGIIGPNGAGKTTLIRLLLAAEQPTSGYVRLGAWVRWAYLGQETHFTNPERTVLAELLAAAPTLTEGAARNLLARFLFTGDSVFQTIGSLSGGEQTRLTLLCLLQKEPHCLILDEPTNHLDIPSRECLEEALATFKGTVIAVSHDRFFLNRIVSRILELRDGRLTSYPGNYNEYQKALILGTTTTAQKAKMTAVRTVMVTGKQSSRQRSRAATVRDLRQEKRLDLDKEISKVEKRMQELEQRFQEPDFYRNRAAHQELNEHQQLTEKLAILYEARQSVT